MYFRENARPPTSKNGSRPCWEQLVQDLSHHKIHKTLGIFIKLHNIRHSKKMQKRFRHSEDFVQCPRFPTPTTSRFGCLGMSEGPDYVSSRSRMLKGDPVILLALRNISWTGKPRGLSTAPKVGWHWWWIWWLDVLRKSEFFGDAGGHFDGSMVRICEDMTPINLDRPWKNYGEIYQQFTDSLGSSTLKNGSYWSKFSERWDGSGLGTSVLKGPSECGKYAQWESLWTPSVTLRKLPWESLTMFFFQPLTMGEMQWFLLDIETFELCGLKFDQGIL